VALRRLGAVLVAAATMLGAVLLARRGHEVVGAIGQIDTAAAHHELTQLRRSLGGRPPTPAQAQPMQALEAQPAPAQLLAVLADSSRDRLRLLDARFDEVVARAVEVSVSGGDAEVLGDDVDGLVTELEHLRVAMEDTDRAAGGTPVPDPPR